MLFNSQLLFIAKVLLLSAIISFLIKYGLDNWLWEINTTFLAITIILSPVVILLIVFTLRYRNNQLT